ncbi:MAG TPA: serine hydrolase domain-containing protein, partial [Gemmataceae bacterium]|nr:serine hydrolase domain-containing protein [Gemmataceae bacterium]
MQPHRLCLLVPLAILTLLLPVPAPAAELPLPTAVPETLGISSERLALIDAVVRQAIERGDLPGAVVVIVHRGHVIFRKAYGLRSRQPDKTAMTPEIVFDLASLTKPLATATAIMLLIEQGKLRPTDRLAQHLPAFARKETEAITVAQLLLHTSGLIADNPLADYRDGPETAWQRLQALKPLTPPGTRFTYSDVNYLLLGKLVEELSGTSLDQFAHKHVFAPLRLNDTGFRPQGKLKERCAPTEKRNGRWLVGEVHDPRADLLGGVAGHAGLFASADDLAVYAQMLLGGGEYRGRRILSAQTVKLMTEPHAVPSGLRSYGWDVKTKFSSNRGEVFPSGESFGHTGFTGTSLWVHPGSQTAVIVL